MASDVEIWDAMDQVIVTGVRLRTPMSRLEKYIIDKTCERIRISPSTLIASVERRLRVSSEYVICDRIMGRMTAAEKKDAWRTYSPDAKALQRRLKALTVRTV